MNIPELWLRANRIVDAQADEAANRCQVHPGQAQKVKDVEAKAARVRRRLRTVLEDVLQADSEARAQVEGLPTLAQQNKAPRPSVMQRAVATSAHAQTIAKKGRQG
eukprot:440276-Pyramimonas_sp.AAC.1